MHKTQLTQQVTEQQVQQNLHQALHNLHMLASDLMIILMVAIIPICIAVLFACSLQKAMKHVPIEKRVFPNWFIWMRFIPLAGFVFDWMMLPFGIPHGLRNAVSENKIAVRAANILKRVGLAHFIFSFGFLVTNTLRIATVNHAASGVSWIEIAFVIFLLLDIPALIIYWVKIVSFRKKYLTASPAIQTQSTEKIENYAHEAFGIKSIIKQAWKNVHGCKWPMWIMILSTVVVQIILNFFSHHFSQQPKSEVKFFIDFILTGLLFAPLMISAVMIGVQHCRNQPVSFKTGFGYIKRWPMLIVGKIVTVLPVYFILLPLFLLFGRPLLHNFLAHHIAVIFLFLLAVFFYAIFVMLTLLFIADKKINPFSALITSIKTVSTHWIRILFTLIFSYLIVLVCLAVVVGVAAIIGAVISHVLPHSISIMIGIAVFIASIWVLPFLLSVPGVIYHRLVDNNN
ncbi:MAG TPA: hypothetical protein VJK30_03085 [Coxiellaceae bacterium]|nr:MAG: hypothetical protein A3E81_03085 [Gammaproteobacteria bacterium RIFCSPHIGHO2_12_FULL_36_30]HLB56299.1 hypothetical protein [Coxiellaceae bacterium]